QQPPPDRLPPLGRPPLVDVEDRQRQRRVAPLLADRRGHAPAAKPQGGPRRREMPPAVAGPDPPAAPRRPPPPPPRGRGAGPPSISLEPVAPASPASRSTHVRTRK